MTSIGVCTRKKTATFDYPMYLSGEWVHRENTYSVLDPENGEVIASVPLAGPDDAKEAVATASRMREAAAKLPSHERVAILNGAAAIVQSEAEEFASLIATEGIKTIREARREVARCVMTLRLAAAEATRLTGETIDFGLRPGSESRIGYTTRIPVGVVVAITPFNDPLNLVAHKVAPAVAAGNSVILKPHRQTPLSALKLAMAFEKAGLPPGILQVVTGSGSTIGNLLVSDPGVRFVSFTGGVNTGRQIMAAAGLKKVAMELGSNCPTIVMSDANIEMALEACVSGAYGAAGQNCLHVQRLYIQRGAYNRFRDDFVSAARALRIGSKLSEDTDMGCVVDAAAVARICGEVSSAVEAGGSLLTGGGRCGTLIEPTVLENVPETHSLVREEIYGPVTVLAPFDTFDEAVSAANSTDFGLQAAIFTRELNTSFEAVKRLEAGTVIVNDSTDYRVDFMPFGGLKSSGLGREGVRDAIMEMTEPKVACFNLACG